MNDLEQTINTHKSPEQQSGRMEHAIKIKSAVAAYLADQAKGSRFTFEDIFPGLLNFKRVPQIFSDILKKFQRDGLIQIYIDGAPLHANDILGLDSNFEIEQLVTPKEVEDCWDTKIFPERKKQMIEDEKLPVIGGIKAFKMNKGRVNIELFKKQIELNIPPPGYVPLYRGISGDYIPAENPETAQQKQDYINTTLQKFTETGALTQLEALKLRDYSNLMAFQRTQSYADNLDLAMKFALEKDTDNPNTTIVQIFVKRITFGKNNSGVSTQNYLATPGSFGKTFTIDRFLEYEYFQRIAANN